MPREPNPDKFPEVNFKRETWLTPLKIKQERKTTPIPWSTSLMIRGKGPKRQGGVSPHTSQREGLSVLLLQTITARVDAGKGKVPKLSTAMKKVKNYLDKGTKAPWETMNKNRAFRSSGHPCQALKAEETSIRKDTGTPTFPRAPNIDQ